MNNEGRYKAICTEIDSCIRHEKTDFYIYPFGNVGKQVKEILNTQYGIMEKGIIDNRIACSNDEIWSVSDLKEKDFGKNSIIIISSEKEAILKDIVKELPPFLNSDQVGFALNPVWEKCIVDNMSFDIFYRHCKIGKMTSSYKSLLDPFVSVESIGRYCSINYSAKVVSNHSMDMVSTHVFLDDRMPEDSDFDFQRKTMFVKEYGNYRDNCWAYHHRLMRKNPPVVIGNDVWIGQNVVILPGVRIHDGAVCAAGAVITNDVPPYSIVAGVPAKAIKKRFSDDIIDALLRIKWWDWSDEKINDNLEFFYQPEKFVEEFYI